MCIPLAREPVLCNRKLAYHCSVAHCLVCEWRLVKLNFTLTAACSVWTLMLNFSYKSSTLIAVFRTVAGSCVISMSSFLSVTRCSVIIIYSVTHTHARFKTSVCMYVWFCTSMHFNSRFYIWSAVQTAGENESFYMHCFSNGRFMHHEVGVFLREYGFEA